MTVAWAQRQEVLETNPARRLTRRKPARRGDRSIPRARLDKRFADDAHALRERVLWRMPYETAARDLGPHTRGWTLHQLRHSALQHLAAAGSTAAELQAKSRHAHLASLGAYVSLGEQTSARVTTDADPAARRRAR